MHKRDNGKSWLLGLLCGALLAAIHLFLFLHLYARDGVITLGALPIASLIVSGMSAWIGSLWTQSWDAGLKAGWLTGLSAGIGAFCVPLTYVLIVTHGQTGYLIGYAVVGLFILFLGCFISTGSSLIGALLGCWIARVER